MKQVRTQRAPSAVPASKRSAGKKSVSSLAADASKGQAYKETDRPTAEQVALRAYFIAERRRTLGMQGDETSDWIAAERELIEELKAV